MADPSKNSVRLCGCSVSSKRFQVVQVKHTDAAIGQWASVAAFALLSSGTYAAPCQSELRILADDLAGVKLAAVQSQYVADKILQAKRQCWVQREQEAMTLINSARKAAGLKKSSGDFDWENVPLESLEEN